MMVLYKCIFTEVYIHIIYFILHYLKDYQHNNINNREGGKKIFVFRGSCDKESLSTPAIDNNYNIYTVLICNISCH